MLKFCLWLQVVSLLTAKEAPQRSFKVPPVAPPLPLRWPTPSLAFSPRWDLLQAPPPLRPAFGLYDLVALI